MQITVTLDLGNDAMQSPEDVRRVLMGLVIHTAHLEAFAPETINLRDANGNTVGRWEVSEANVCITGNPAKDGHCDDCDCPCQSAESLLDLVKQTQTDYWNALRALENEIGGGLELDGSRDYEGVTVAELRASVDEN